MKILKVNQVSKAFREYPSVLARLWEWGSGRDRHTLNWVLKEIDFDIDPGESIGLVGRNGAGKSTLLKIITGVSVATSGSVYTEGKIAALLELGMGFHPEFTGRQNALMQAYLQGIDHQQAEALLPQIAAFAEIGDYFDRPLRVYSSGMHVRLAFSVATAIRPDILIVDEALAVGDAYFQHKCFDRIRAFRAEGTTLLFVSHDPGAVKTLCSRAILIDQGRVAMDGQPAHVLDYYNALIAPQTPGHEITASGLDASGTRSGSGLVRFSKVQVVQDQEVRTMLRPGLPVNMLLELKINQALPDLTVGLLIKDRLGNDIYGTNTFHQNTVLGPVRQGDVLQLTLEFPNFALGPGHYSLTIAAHASSDHLAGNYDWWDRALVFQVLPPEGGSTIGVCYMPVNIRSTCDEMQRD